MKNKLIIGGFLAALISCGPNNPDNTERQSQSSASQRKIPSDLPVFNPDSAYEHTRMQVSFGPRVPNTIAHVAGGDYLIKELKRYGTEVIVQTGNVTAYTGESLRFRNIVARIQPDLKDRLMISCHWDTRPFSDQDKQSPKDRFDGAVDGAASAGIMLEIARVMATKPANVGVDLVFFDAEDYGSPQNGNTYCLGSQYFASNPPIIDFKPRFGINLDMVAAPGATFFREGYSMQYASGVVNTVWSVANQLGYSQYFKDGDIGAITDDHYFINTILGVPTADIIHHDQSSSTGFGEYWHTQQDNMLMVDRETMRVVGHTMLAVIYSENTKN
jgi:hypothetical protein